MQLSLIITGDKQLDATLATLPVKLQKKGIRKATRKAAKFVLADVKSSAPYDEGNLEASLQVRTAKKTSGRPLSRGTFGHAVATRNGWFGGDEFYGGFVEFGTKRRSAHGKNRGVVDAVEFMQHALYGNRQAILQLFRAELSEALRQIAAEARVKG